MYEVLFHFSYFKKFIYKNNYFINNISKYLNALKLKNNIFIKNKIMIRKQKNTFLLSYQKKN